MNRLSIAALLLCLSRLQASAEPWHVLGPRALGMGGAFVAVAQGPVAQYWNPAGLAQEAVASKWGLQAPVGGRVEFTGNVLQDANALGDLASKYSAVQSAQTNGTAINADQMAAVVKGIATIKHLNDPGKGAIASVEGGANFKAGGWAVSVNNFTTLGATPFVDTTNIGLGTISGAGGVTFNGVSAAAPADTASRDSIASAINTIGYANLNTLVCGSATCINATQNGAITNSTTLANALVNQAVTNGVSATAIQQAADAMVANAGEAAAVISNVANGNNNPYTNNQSNLTVRGGSFTEIAFGHGRALFLPGLMLGANLKMISGRIGYERFNVLTKDAGSTGALKDFKNNTATSVQPGLDLGVLWKLDEILPALPLNPRWGVVARNVNNPRFNQPAQATSNGESSKYSLNGQIRSGLAFSPWNWWNISADVDLTKNNTPIPGYQSQMAALGTEINIFNRSWINIPLRAGIMKNVTTSQSKPSYAAGFGLNFLHFILDVGGSISSERTTIDTGDKIPSNAAVSAQLAFMFGGAPDSKRKPSAKAQEAAPASSPADVRQEAEKAQKALDAESKKTP